MMFPSNPSASNSSNGAFRFPPLFNLETQKGDAFASSTFSSTGMTNHGRIPTSTFYNTSPFMNGPFATKSKNNLDQGRGTRVAVYHKTADPTSKTEKLVSISAMNDYKDKNHEELRFEDYNFTGKGWFDVTSSTVQSGSFATSFSTVSWATPSVASVQLSQPTPQPPSNPFMKLFPSVSTTSASFTSQPCQFSSFKNTSFISPPLTNGSNSFNPFTPKANVTAPASLKSFDPFTALSSSSSFAPLNHNSFINPFTSLATHSSSSNPFTSSIARIDHKPSSLTSFWSTPMTGPFISTGSATANCIPISFVSSGLSSTFNQPTTLFNPSVNLTQNCNGSTTATTTGINCQSSVSQLPLSQITNTEKPSSVTNPFGTLPPNPRMLIDCSQSKQPIQYGISSIPVKEKPAPVKHSLLTTNRLSRRIKLPVQKYDPKLVSTKKPFFSDTKEIPVPAYVPRENPRALVICPEKWAMTEIIQEEKVSDNTYENKKDDATKDTTTILDVLVKLQQPDYYTQPQISELEAKERVEPGYCACVKDFVIGRDGYGSIKFLGETDVRNVDIETDVQFNNREVIVYMDDNNKPPVGEGLNKAAEITLLNIKLFNKKTGLQYTHGSKVNRYKEMLKKKTEAQGAEFVSYDPFEGEWKFRVQHF